MQQPNDRAFVHRCAPDADTPSSWVKDTRVQPPADRYLTLATVPLHARPVLFRCPRTRVQRTPTREITERANCRQPVLLLCPADRIEKRTGAKPSAARRRRDAENRRRGRRNAARGANLARCTRDLIEYAVEPAGGGYKSWQRRRRKTERRSREGRTCFLSIPRERPFSSTRYIFHRYDHVPRRVWVSYRLSIRARTLYPGISCSINQTLRDRE